MLNYADGKFDKIDTVDVGFAWDSNIKISLFLFLWKVFLRNLQ